jgi:hypothetical protein
MTNAEKFEEVFGVPHEMFWKASAICDTEMQCNGLCELCQLHKFHWGDEYKKLEMN